MEVKATGLLNYLYCSCLLPAYNWNLWRGRNGDGQEVNCDPWDVGRTCIAEAQSHVSAQRPTKLPLHHSLNYLLQSIATRPRVLSMFPFQPALKRHQLFSYLLTPPITCLSIRLPFLFCSLSWALLSLLVDTAPVNHPFSWALQPPQLGSICPSFLCYSCRDGTKSFCHVLWNLEWNKVFSSHFKLGYFLIISLNTSLTGVYFGLGNKPK